MSAGIFQNDTMFSVKETPWHHLGKVIGQAPTISEGIELAGLGWKVQRKSLHYTTDSGEQILVPNKGIVREDTQDLLGVVGPNYTPLQNEDAFKFFDPWVEKRLISLETAGSLFNGRRIWVLGKINADPISIKGDDIVEKYVLLSNGHDGTMAVRVGYNPVRVVCNNTLTAAIERRSQKMLRIFHSKQVKEALEKTQEIMDIINRDFLATEEQYRFLARKQVMSQEDVRRLVKTVFFPDKGKDDMEKERQKAFFNSMVETNQARFEHGIGNDLKGISGTYWALYNGVTQYLTHEAGSSEERRLNSLWFETGKKQSKAAFDFCMARVVGQ